MTGRSPNLSRTAAILLAACLLLASPGALADTSTNSTPASQSVVHSVKAHIVRAPARLTIVSDDKGASAAWLETRVVVAQPQVTPCKARDRKAVRHLAEARPSTAPHGHRAGLTCEMIVFDLQ